MPHRPGHVRLLVIHNYYTEITGEDLMVRLVSRSLKDSGRFDIVEYSRESRSFHRWPWFRKALALVRGNLPVGVPRDFIDCLDKHRPQAALVHNLIPLINPWVLTVLKRRGIPVIASIYNFRLLCPRGTCVRDEKFCMKCTRRSLFYSIRYNCLRNRLYSVLYAYRFFVHGRLVKNIDAFICTVKYRTLFFRQLLAPKKVFFLVHYMNIDPGLVESREPKKDYILFAGRFVEEKGIRIILEAALRLPHRSFRLYGDGPLKEMVRRYIEEHRLTNIALFPWEERSLLYQIIRDARLLLFPSVYLEYGMIMCEAMLLKTPVIVAMNAVSRTVVRHGENGFLFDPKDIDSLVAIVEQVWSDEEFRERVAAKAHEEVRPYNDPGRFAQTFTDICRIVRKRKETSFT